MSRESVNFPLVSIVTPTYNQADSLKETIDSVLAQTYPNIEYIVINDGSTDNTECILNDYRTKLKFISHENIGQSATLNKGWDLSSGQFISYLSSDDILKPDAVMILVNAIKEFSSDGIGLVYGDYQIIDADGFCVKLVRSEEYSEIQLTRDLICQPGILPLFSRSLFENIGGWDVSLKQVPDFDFWLKCSRLVKFKRVNEVIGGYRVHNGSASFSVMNEKKANEIIYVVNRFYSTQTNNSEKNTAIANSYVIAAKNNLQSKRFVMSIKNVLVAAKYDPKVLFSVLTYRKLLSGLIRRLIY